MRRARARTARTLGLILFATATLPTASRPEGAEASSRALAIAAEVERIAAATPLWPGFAPLEIPLAIYDGERTWLFRHPSPPDGLSAVPGSSPPAFAMVGRHPNVRSNTSETIGGVATATLVATETRAASTPTALAAVALHESFHVFQRQRHPTWIGNEGDLLLYPVDDPELLAARRLETEALRQALAADALSTRRCLADRVVAERTRRFARMDAAFSRYERLTELNEGLAAYVQIRAEGRNTVDLPADGFPATAVRDRTYLTGPAFALLLDRLRPDWAEALEAEDEQMLDELLAEVATGADPASCPPDAEREAEIARAARADAAGVAAFRGERRRAFDERPGWRVVVEAAAGAPLWPQGFDPLNVERVAGGLLHGRYLELGNDAARIEMLRDGEATPEAFTEAAGEHPLFSGVSRVVFAGLDEPRIERDGDSLRVRTRGLDVALDAAVAEVAAPTLRLRLLPPGS